jgi:preprotein translocase subunit SecG
MTSTLLIIQIVLSLMITVTVLLQKSSSIGLGAYSGSNETMFGAKGPAGFLAKFTFTLAILFIINTLALGYFYNKENSKSVVDKIESSVPTAPKSDNSVPTTTSAPSAPINTEKKVEKSNDVPTAPIVESKPLTSDESNTTTSSPKEENNTSVESSPANEVNSTATNSNTPTETNTSN